MTLFYLINYPLTLFLIFGIFICGLILLFYTSYTKLKKKEIQKISMISSELELERSISRRLQATTKRNIQEMEQETQQKFLNIRVTILNIHHTLWEIFT